MKQTRKQILVAYSSGYGATREISEVICEILEQQAFVVDLKSIDDIKEIDAYDYVVVGTSIRADRVLANTRDFFSLHSQLLSQKKVALFMVCLTASTEEGRKKAMQDYLPQITENFPSVDFLSTAAFGGKIDYSKMNSVMAGLVKRVVLEKTGEPSNGSIDNRDWESIRRWARDLATILQNSR